MNTLPPGVTLTTTLSGRVFVHTATEWLGEAWEYQGAWMTAAATGAERDDLPSQDAAIRWVCLQARPVVYQVRLTPDGWDVIPPDGTEPWPFGRDEVARVIALETAHSLARRDALARAL